ncbi:long-chain fatty acid transport protein [Chromobacterium alkanivorans]|uniref:OmpP1/FadL family transporter n=1 Tax=Chromobacterium alkanivorans TaxID=1071719 RepID=UPI0019680547|nr:OmpP1/FadL family transporter [Chromobacterium alkanivorans]MBN3002982.1 transporter [Chromobacterium alkanivorans]MCS3803847.1 long-chain fatty acid transport protein [Chromobacterium alkanivorans]MCS3818048.1 long-chain fatty acid transport protein [Chromobacterium alkanivorans]MCS3875668.1 long-chain fatty acid transport protein [Chromobacterium alkanivorans]
MKLKHLSLSVMVMGATFGLMSTQAVASGYQFGSQSVSGQGTAHANGAEANDPSTIFSNPAGLSRLEGTQFSGGATLVVPHSEYTDNGSTNILGQSTGGGNGGSFAPKAVAAPNFYLSHKLNDKINLGLGVFVPYGAKLDYGFDWAGRYALKSVNLQSFNFNPSMSFKLDDRHSFGFGISAQYMDAKLQQMADATSGLALKAAAAGGITGPFGPGGATVTVTNPAQISAIMRAGGIGGDGLADVEGNDWGFGWNIGYMFQLNENTRFGLAYRSSIKQSLTGSSTWTFNNVKGNVTVGGVTLPAAVAAKLVHPNASAKVDVTTPETASANFFHQLNPKWAVMGDVTWVANSQMKDIVIQQSTVGTTAQGDMVIHQNWRDTWRVSLGANYQYSDAWLFRGGVAWEQSPLQSDKDRHPALPDSDRLWLSLGANYKINKQSSVDFAYSFINFANANVDYTDGCSPTGKSPTTGAACTGNGGTVKGSYKTYLQLIGLQYNYRF